MFDLPNVTPEQQKQAMWMSLLSAGAGMMDPRGTYGHAGASMNRAFKQGLGTYMPMVQWMQKSNLAKEDRDYRKQRDKAMDRFRKNAESAQAVRLDLMQQGRDLDAERLDLARTSAATRDALLNQQLRISKGQYDMQQELIRQFMGPGKVSDLGPRQRGPVAQPGDVYVPPVKGLPPNYGGMQMYETPGMRPMPGEPQARPQARPQAQGGMASHPFQMMLMGDVSGMDAFTEMGKHQLARQGHIQDKMADLGLQADEYEIRQSPFGLNAMILNKRTKKPVYMIDTYGNVNPAPGTQGGQGEPYNWEKYFD